MRKNNNIIEINGERYDAITGVALSHSETAPAHAKKAATHSSETKPVAVVHNDLHRPKPSMRDVVHHKAKSAAPHKPKSSKTLMRHAVKKPSPSLKRVVRAQGPTDEVAKRALADIEVKRSVSSLNPKLAKHASQVPKSELVKHFSPVTASGGDNRPPLTKERVSDFPKLPSQPTASQPVPPKPASKAQSTSDLLEKAINQANSHEQQFTQKSRKHGRRKANALAVSVAAVLLLAFVGYQELPNMKLEFASAKAGFSANMPSYRPAGYSLGGLNYSQGVVATQFKSNSDQRSYSITQKTSNWDSKALLENYVSPKTQNYQSVQSGGNTIYLYGNGDATWVSGGIWYVVQSNGSLTNRQLVQLATSL